uniref:Cyclin-dependent kinase inhibitor domain-containing protein n=1 Tax=Clytia hemisphaerica TaxID=252671 RepID=A0A7M5V321_9CNID
MLEMAVKSDYNLRNRRAKRRLWPIQPKDQEDTRRDIQKQYKKTQKEFTEKYNFDFETTKPLEGKYKWVPALESPIASPSCLMITDSEETCCSLSLSENNELQFSHVHNTKSTKNKPLHKNQSCTKGKVLKVKNKVNKRSVSNKPPASTFNNRKLQRSSFTYSLRNKTSTSAILVS